MFSSFPLHQVSLLLKLSHKKDLQKQIIKFVFCSFLTSVGARNLLKPNPDEQ